MITESIELQKAASTLPLQKMRVVTTSYPADISTPIGVYLKLRDRFPGSILLESADNQEGKNSKSFIGFDILASIVANRESCAIEIKNEKVKSKTENTAENPFLVLHRFISSFAFSNEDVAESGLIGYIGYDAVKYMETVRIDARQVENAIPIFQFNLFRFIIEFDHLKHKATVRQNVIEGEDEVNFPSEVLSGSSGTTYPFRMIGEQFSFTTSQKFIANVVRGKEYCRRGDVFQVVLSRKFAQKFQGDDFNVYRSLRMVNPSPYLFYADFKNFRLMGSSPEAQLVSKNGEAEIHPIAGTYKKTGVFFEDLILAEKLLADKKESAEHVMLVDLARNDLARFCNKVEVVEYKQVYNYSHVMHLVSKVKGKINSEMTVVDQITHSFPAGTLSGAPKVRAMQIIDDCEEVARDWYGGCIGMIGFDGSVNMAIMIRTFLSRNNELHYQAGAGVVIDSVPENELNEIDNKLAALKLALEQATKL